MNRYSTLKRSYIGPKSLAQALARKAARDEKRASRGQQRPKGKGLARGKGLSPRVPSKAKTVTGDSARMSKDEMDQLVREIIRLRDDRCFTCPRGRWGAIAIEVGHMYRRGIEVLRWNLLNCNGQCSLCNSAHETDPTPYHVAFIRKYGVDAYGQLETLSLSKHKHSYVELFGIRDGLRRILSELKQKAKAA